MTEEFFTIHTLATFCGVTDRTMEKWYAEGKLPVPTLVRRGTKLWTPSQAREVLEFRKNQTPEARKRRITLRGRHGR